MQTKNIRPIFFAAIISLLVAVAYGSSSPVYYKIHVNPADISGFDVEMRISGGRGTLRVAMAAHPEYDDRYWRYIENFSAVDGRGQKLNVAKDEDAVWRIKGKSKKTKKQVLSAKEHIVPEGINAHHNQEKRQGDIL